MAESTLFPLDDPALPRRVVAASQDAGQVGPAGRDPEGKADQEEPSADEIGDLFGDPEAPSGWSAHAAPAAGGSGPGAPAAEAGFGEANTATWLPAGDGGAQLAPIPGLLDGLNEPQRAACTHLNGPLLILAGPGSGKTRVITHRIAWLLTECGVRPDELLAITFTNKAAKEMRARVERMLPGIRGAWISTFHAMCARILRSEIEVLDGFTRDFTIYDTSDRNQLLKRVLKDLNLDLTQFRPAMVGGWISNNKNCVRSDDSYEFVPEGSELGFDDELLRKVEKKYGDELRSANALDFDDLLGRTLEIFEKYPGVRDAYASRFRHVMVDEYQDTNQVQYRLAKHLASVHGNIAVCGDPDQSIYAWRGADIRNILGFEEDFGAAKIVKLEQNYRSKGNVLAAASAVIGNNTERKAKDLWTEADAGEQIYFVECADENDEGREIAAQIRALADKKKPYSDVAVFYRANFMQRALETALRMSGIPYQVVAGVEFYARREIRDLIGYLHLVVNPRDDVAFRRVVNVPARGVGEKSLQKLSEWAADRRLSMLEACGSEEALAAIRGRAKKGLAAFYELIQRLSPLQDQDAGTAFTVLLDEIDRDAWMAAMDDGMGVAEREDNVAEIVSHAEEYDRLNADGKLRGFLQDVALVSEVDDLDEGSDLVSLMTLHAAKGLEFPYVFIAGVEEELLPHARALAEAVGNDDGIEEERRLFYVGLTRARERLFLSQAKTRLHFGDTRWTTPSRFLDEIPPELIEGGEPDMEEAEALGSYEPAQATADLAVGVRVRHDHFGVGRIELLQGSGINARATVNFIHHGSKQLLLQYANLKTIGGAE